MKRIRISLSRPQSETIREATRIIQAGGVVVHPAETLYGLGCDPADPAALKRVLELKNRPAQKGMLVLIPDVSHVAHMALRLPPSFDVLSRRLWPGPFTLLLPASRKLSPLLTGKGGKIGLRLSDSVFLKKWMEELREPLVSTSANRSGCPPMQEPDQLQAVFKSADLLLDAGRLPSGRASTIIDLTGPRPQILRRGDRWEIAQKVIDGL